MDKWLNGKEKSFTITLTINEQEFVANYLEAVRFTEEDSPDFETYGPDLCPYFIRESTLDCLSFYSRIECYITPEKIAQSAHDFWLTRNGHGVGFWDRPEIYGDHFADRFTQWAKGYGEANVAWGAI